MCSPVGHSLMGAIIYVAFNKEKLNIKEHWKGYLSYMFIANLPDLDVVPGIINGDINLYHHQITHTFFFAFMFTLFVYLFYRLRGKEAGLKSLLPFFILYVSHIVLDYFAADNRPPYGEELFWPFSSRYYISSFTPFLDIVRQKTIASAFNRHNMVAVLREIGIFLPVWILLFVWQRGRYSSIVGL